MNKHRKDQILITGGAGFIGTNVAIEAVNRGYDVTVLDNLSRKGSDNNIPVLKSMGVDFVWGDITRISTLFLDRPYRFNCIIHLAANTGIGKSLECPYYDFEQNALGTLNALELANRHDSVLIYASTNKVYSSDINVIPVKETDTRYSWNIQDVNELYPTDGDHHTPYGASKLTGDMYCREYYQSYGTKTVVNRMSCIYGLYQNGAEEQGWVDHFIRANMFGNGVVNIYGDGKQVRDVLFGSDLARLYIDELENIDKCAGEVFNIGGGLDNTLSLLECMEIIKKETDIGFQPKYCDWRLADQKVYISDISKIDKTIGWKPTVKPVDGIRKIIERYRILGELN